MTKHALPNLGDSELANRNDEGRNFKQIANAIEKAGGL